MVKAFRCRARSGNSSPLIFPLSIAPLGRDIRLVSTTTSQVRIKRVRPHKLLDQGESWIEPSARRGKVRPPFTIRGVARFSEVFSAVIRCISIVPTWRQNSLEIKCHLDREPHVRLIFERQPFGELERLITQRLLEFLDTDIFPLSREQYVALLEPLIESWDIDLATFALEIALNPRIVTGQVKRFEFIEREPGQSVGEEPGLTEFFRLPP
jgi:hypothetical protein